MSATVLLVEDDRELRHTLRDALEVEGYRVLASASLADAQAVLAHAGRSLAATDIDLVLLDLGLPDGDGADLLGALRRNRMTPVVVISARDAEDGKVRLLDGGADDYLVKPFALGELLARLRVALRHRGRAMVPAITRYEHTGLVVDVAAHRVTLDGEPVHLTPTELRLLERLVRQAGQLVTHRALLADVWGPEHVDDTHYLRLYMGQLRAKLEVNSAEPRRLLTEPGIGYRLAEAE
jgi:two-component system KDP operon response regulator KdpE